MFASELVSWITPVTFGAKVTTGEPPRIFA